MKTKFMEKDQNWQNESTTYWFMLSGTDYGTGWQFKNDVYGIFEQGPDSYAVTADNIPLREGDKETIAVFNSIADGLAAVKKIAK